MSTMTLKHPSYFSRSTASASEQGVRFARARVLSRPQIIVESEGEVAPLEDRLATALHQATEVVRHSTRDLGNERAEEVIARVSDLLCADDWDEDDEILKVASVRTLIRTLIALDCETGGLALTRGGNLTISWAEDGRNLRVEALPDGTVSWALVSRVGDSIEAKHQQNDKITNLWSVFRA